MAGLLDTRAQMQATPRTNRLAGLLADALASVDGFARKPFGYDNPPAGLLSDALAVPQVQRTLDRLSYGEPLTTGKGQATALRPDTVDAAMAVAPVVAKWPKQAGGLLAAVAGGGVGPDDAMRAATVWHGTPHKFDAFDAGKIGTGEGAQAYGHGIYFAESPEVAQQYADELGTRVYKGGKQLQGHGALSSWDRSPLYTSNADANDFITMHLGDLSKARHDILNTIRGMRAAGAPEAVKDYQQALAAVRGARGQIVAESSGNLYSVDLPDEMIARMLDWDKRLNQQNDSVYNLFRSAYQKGLVKSAPSSDTGTLLLELQQSVGRDTAAQMLRDAGVPGVRYLDGGSRGAGSGTSNFVVFPGEENKLQILTRNGKKVHR